MCKKPCLAIPFGGLAQDGPLRGQKRTLRGSDANQLSVKEFANSYLCQLSSVTGVLHSAEWKLGCSPRGAVDEDHSRFDPTSYPLAPLDVPGHDRAAQTEWRVIGELDRLFFSLHPEDHRDWRENLLKENRIFPIDVSKDRWFEVITWPADPVATQEDFGSALYCSADLTKGVIQCSSRAERPERSAVVCRIARNQLLQLLTKTVQEYVGYLFMEDESLARDATLAGIVHARPDGPLHRSVQVCIFQHDEGIAPAQLHRALLESLARFRRDGGTRAFTSRKSYALDPCVCDGRSRLCIREKNIGVDSGRSACIEEHFLKRQGALWHIGSMLDDDRIPDHQIWTGDAHQLIVGKVPGFNAKNHSEWSGLNPCLALCDIEGLRCEKGFRTICIVIENIRAKIHLGPCLTQ